MRRALLLGLLLIASGLAGCIGNTDGTDATETASTSGTPGDLSAKRFDVLPVEVEWFSSTVDGERIHNAVYRPDTNGTVPVFINFSPYWGDGATERGDAFARYMISEYVPRGYAVVLTAIRGTGHSEGCFQIAGDKEIDDMRGVIEHFAEADWSNGKIVAGGKSYDSTPQNGLVAKGAPDSLVGLFHVSGITDMYRYNYRQGVTYPHGTLFNTYYYNQGISEYAVPAPFTGATSGNATHEDEDADSLARAVDDAACPEFPEIQAHGIGSGITGQKTDYWTERDWNRYIASSDWNGSIFFVHGLQDWNVKPDHILPWLEELPDQVRVKGWLHQNTENLGHVYPMRADWNTTMLRWLDHVTKGVDTGFEHGFEVEGSDDLWRASETWPPRDVEPRRIDLSELSPTDGQAAANGTILEAADNQTLRYAGQPVLRVDATVNHPDPVLTAVLYEQAPDGTVTWINEGILRAVYKDGLEAPTPLEPGSTYTFEVPMYPQDDVLEPGPSWVLEIGGEPQQVVASPDQRLGVTYDLEEATLELPMAPVDTTLAQQPEPVPCFAC